ncbi:MAG: hypothetical protein IJU41_03635 [Clostridia bacterium]|nr:hypothetical protein [Clostridia bacterium]
MPANVDSEVRLRVGFDNSGIKKGVNSVEQALGGLKTTFGKLGAAIAAAFSVKAIISFTKAAREAYKVQMEQEIKLATIMRQRTGATNEEIQSLLDLTSAEQQLGIVGDEVQIAGLQQLATFTKTTGALKALLPAMNNLLAQQNGFEISTGSAVNVANLMGKVLQGQTGALTRVGISFDEAQEKVLKYGTESERAAMLAKVITQNVGDMNSALAKTDIGRQKQLANVMGDIKEQFGQAINQILILFLPALQAMAKMLQFVANAAKALASAIASVFGAKSNNAQWATTTAGIEGAVSAQNDLTEAVEATDKASKKSTASFDEINKISSETASEAASGPTESEIGGVGGMTSEPITPEIDDSKIVDFLESVKKKFKDVIKWWGDNIAPSFDIAFSKISPNFEPMKSAFEKVKTDILSLAEPMQTLFDESVVPYAQAGIESVGTVIGGGLDSILNMFTTTWDAAFMPLTEGAITMILPTLFGIATENLKAFTTAFESFKPIFDNIWTDGVIPAISLLVQIWNDLWDGIQEAWEKWGEPIFTQIDEAINNAAEIFDNAWNGLVKPIWDIIIDALKDIWDNHLKPLWDNLMDFVGEVVNCALVIYNKAFAPIVKWMQAMIYPVIVKVVGGIVNAVKGVINFVIDGINSAITTLKMLVHFITSIFSGDWKGAWESIVNMFKNIWDRIVAVAKVPINLVIGFINKMISAVVGALNKLIDGINSLSFDMPDWLGGAHIGFDFPHFTVPQIPLLAQGAVIPPNREFLAVLGDQKSGTNIETPLETMIAAFNAALDRRGGGNQTAILEIDGERFGRLIYRLNKNESRRIGVNFAEV